MPKYNVLIRLLHTLVALGVILQVIVGFFFDDMFSKLNPAFFMTIHKSIGLSLFLLIVFLIITRIFSNKIPYPKEMPVIQRMLAKLVHWGLYLCILLMSLSGFIASQLFHSKWQYFYWFDIPNFLPKNPGLGREIFSWHPFIAMILLVLVILHILAALSHQFIAKDKIMQKMF
ncbi:cytochrome b [Fastidiosibacter lacustris]|uniref:cytochrome b n=1 Tax=Fastidiosibacter lacustris TaxID=2056695 RepID=UPI000E34C7E3|nr:cytochrome b/b6 domain-containing protein [Fastidiosibacter lacustris]